MKLLTDLQNICVRVLQMQRIVACIPIDESVVVFCDNIDNYTMKEASDYGITVWIAYEPWFVRNLIVLLVKNGYPLRGHHQSIEEFLPKLKTLRGATKDKKWMLSKFSNNLSEKKSNRWL
mgnify:CR=1 FL=1